MDPSSKSPNQSTATDSCLLRIAILDRGDREARRRSALEESRFLPLFRALADLGAHGERAVYDEESAAEVREQILRIVRDQREQRVAVSGIRGRAARPRSNRWRAGIEAAARYTVNQ